MERLLQTLLVQRSFEDEGWADDEAEEDSSYTSHDISAVSGTLNSTTFSEDWRSGLDPLTTLRAMRRAGGPLAGLSRGAQEELLGGTLYEYSDGAPPSTWAETVSGERIAPGSDFDETASMLESTLDETHSFAWQTASVSGTHRAANPEDSFSSEHTFSDTLAAMRTRLDNFFPLRSMHRTTSTFPSDSEFGGDGDATLRFQQLVRDGALSGLFERSAHNLLQMSAVISGHRLTEEQIEALPKVRFDQADEHTCAICLEAFQPGALLNALRCGHFFHVDCLAEWFQRSTRCPLCRSSQ